MSDMTTPSHIRNPIRNAAELMVQETAGYPLDDWLLDRADEGKSSRHIADELAALTNGVISVTHSTIQAWLKRAGWEAQTRRETA